MITEVGLYPNDFSKFSIETENEPDCIIYDSSNTQKAHLITLVNSFPRANILKAKCASQISKVNISLKCVTGI